MGTTRRGREAERHAERWLKARGLQVLARNYRCRFGELDLVMRQGDTLVFVEVRLRRDERFGGARASVTRAKQRRLLAAANHYLMCHPALARLPCRFDVLALTGDPGGAVKVDWICHAFSGEY